MCPSRTHYASQWILSLSVLCLEYGLKKKKTKKQQTCDLGWSNSGAEKYGNSINGDEEGKEWGENLQNKSYPHSCSLGVQNFTLTTTIIFKNNGTFSVNSLSWTRGRECRTKVEWVSTPYRTYLYISLRYGRRKWAELFSFPLFSPRIFTYSFSLKFLAFPFQNCFYPWAVLVINILFRERS